MSYITRGSSPSGTAYLIHLTFRILLLLASMGFIPKRLLECLNKPPICVACNRLGMKPIDAKSNKIQKVRCIRYAVALGLGPLVM